jgi:aspartyl-tRNA(Asn)/glutamyl-tRNA(Gln) amidotransferase subunit B
MWKPPAPPCPSCLMPSANGSRRSTACASTKPRSSRPPLADNFEAAAVGSDAKAVANYVTGDLARLLNASGRDITESKVTPAQLRDLLALRDSGQITNNTAKSVLTEMFETGQTAQAIVEAKGLAAVSDDSAIVAEVDKVIAANPDIVAKIKAGNDKSKNALTGQVMKATKGQARPDVINQLLDERLAAL